MIPSGRAKNDSPGDRVGGRQSRGEGGEAVTGVSGGGEVVTGQDFVLEVDSAENSSFHVGGQRVPPLVFKSHRRLSSRWAAGTI